jgi:hypothetical protein
VAANEGVAPPGCLVRIVPSQNYGDDDVAKIGLSVHHIDGSIAAAESRFMDPSQQASAHYGVAFNGATRLWVPTDKVAYAQCAGNWQGWITVELESNPNDENGPATPAQVDAVGDLIRFHKIPALPAVSPFSGGVGYHRQFGGVCAVHWGQTACPGDGIVMQIERFCKAASGDLSTPDSHLPRKRNPKMWIAYVLEKNWCDVYYNGVLVDAFVNDDHPNQFNVGQKFQGYLDGGAARTIYATEAEYAPTRKRLATAAA